LPGIYLELRRGSERGFTFGGWGQALPPLGSGALGRRARAGRHRRHCEPGEAMADGAQRCRRGVLSERERQRRAERAEERESGTRGGATGGGAASQRPG